MAKLENIRSIISQIKPQMQEVQATNKPQQPITNGSLAVDNKVLPLPDTKQQSNNHGIMNILVNGKDYGTIHGIKGTILFKTGALKILRHMNLKYSFTVLDKTVNLSQFFISYTIKVVIINKDNETIYESIGSANSLEAKFKKTGLSSDNLLCQMAVKRALVCAVKDLIC